MSHHNTTGTPNDINLSTDSSVDISEVTAPSTSVQIEREQEIQAQINIGQYPTPEHISIEINEKSYEEGYDSDGQIRPFYDAVKGEGGVEFYKEAILHPDTDAVTNDGVRTEHTKKSRSFKIQDGDIRKLLVKYLREECKLLGIDMRGNKAPLIERLKAAREKKLCYLPPQQVDNPERNQSENDGFSPLVVEGDSKVSFLTPR